MKIKAFWQISGHVICVAAYYFSSTSFMLTKSKKIVVVLIPKLDSQDSSENQCQSAFVNPFTRLLQRSLYAYQTLTAAVFVPFRAISQHVLLA